MDLLSMLGALIMQKGYHNFRLEPAYSSKHAAGRKKTKNWKEKKRTRRLIAKASKKRNR